MERTTILRHQLQMSISQFLTFLISIYKFVELRQTIKQPSTWEHIYIQRKRFSLRFISFQRNVRKSKWWTGPFFFFCNLKHRYIYIKWWRTKWNSDVIWWAFEIFETLSRLSSKRSWKKKHAINLLPVLINASKEMEKERVGNERGEEQRDGLMSARTGLARDL